MILRVDQTAFTDSGNEYLSKKERYTSNSIVVFSVAVGD